MLREGLALAVGARKVVRQARSASASSGKGRGQRGPRLSTGRALVLGAGLTTAGRWLLAGRADQLRESARQWLEEQAEGLEEDEAVDEFDDPEREDEEYDPEWDEEEDQGSDDEEDEGDEDLDEDDAEEYEPEEDDYEDEEDEAPVPASRGRARPVRRG